MFLKFLLSLEKVQGGRDFPKSSKLLLQQFEKGLSLFLNFRLKYCFAGQNLRPRTSENYPHPCPPTTDLSTKIYP
jgi:hypothetical protein